ncbi:superoxide dismutase [Halomonas sp. MCCC 1A11036]|uniref:Superoxide dismutase [Cu-Zn] n=1 Tax=Billgrantia zhangzhouensis TaxID=2733481 RepID=A0ABS9AJ43_9GAMM|nr:superoxide dismutase [Cu-Zn] SodC [Halomonas zhangzhouensis]MCE8021749.1 superoxide dismutase [Halomonas zhangzhouensis]
MRHAKLTGVAAASLLLAAGVAQAQEGHEVEMNLVSTDGVEDSIGTITLEDTDHGLLLTPELSGLPPGVYGFHVHENPNCEPGENEDGEMTAAGEAGGHYDPEDTGTHQGPYGDGHLGDLPVLIVNEDGEATLPVLAPRLSVEDIQDRSLMIHEGGDTYSDEPELGGGGGRMACGVIEP